MNGSNRDTPIIQYPPGYRAGQLPSAGSNPEEQGAIAYFDGREIGHNPHPIPSRRAAAWDAGYLETAQEVEGFEREPELGGEG